MNKLKPSSMDVELSSLPPRKDPQWQEQVDKAVSLWSKNYTLREAMNASIETYFRSSQKITGESSPKLLFPTYEAFIEFIEDCISNAIQLDYKRSLPLRPPFSFPSYSGFKKALTPPDLANHPKVLALYVHHEEEDKSVVDNLHPRGTPGRELYDKTLLRLTRKKQFETNPYW